MTKISSLDSKKADIAVMGLGYVGLPLAIEFSKVRSVIGFDINDERVRELKLGIDKTLEVKEADLHNSSICFSSKIDDIKKCKIYIVTVPTPINENNLPDLEPLQHASELIGSFLKKGDLVIYESTVYPGATEDFCGQILEKVSNLVLNKDFHLGYSPERVNPGDKNHKIPNIIKVTSGSTDKTAEKADKLYVSIIDAGTYKAGSIKVAEAAKVIENTQRDLNIALMNELSIIFDKLQIDTNEVINAAATKWNFLSFYPGLVGGHCIGVDPYYLTYRAQQVGYEPEIILAGRKLNDGMSVYIAKKFLQKLDEKNISKNQSNVLILGVSFKENCPDIRNSKVLDLVSTLDSNNLKIEVFDPWVEQGDLPPSPHINMISQPKKNFYDGIILAVAHNQFLDLGVQNIKDFAKKTHVFFDLKGVFSKEQSDFRL